MGLFRRGAANDAAADDAVTEIDTPDEVAESVPDEGAPENVLVPERDHGPWDVSEVDGLGTRVDLGSIWLPGVVGMELRMEIDKATEVVSAAAVNLDGSALQVQAFAAPRTEGIWDEIREEIAESIVKQGGSADDLPGPFGRELLARLPVRTEEGRTGHRPARFVGADGPRWFLRGVITGRAAVDPEAARALEAVFADIVVDRGQEARAPRDLLALRLPGQSAPVVPQDPEARQASDLDLLRRGPEITEIR
ncbi:DUF3710 domain-containing protein [Cellulomonas sp. P24]|uniref:DUF3710 domain-containing protein n=1 Tax=Cellulomonas sp. P24 TaxID=2885206 RepID=UPI00216AF80F|nr:DUF3710 domain-containing protein [Cellulomonas sp. P24]MCR6494257.1 DUF3710 domain-containing protein [Cellulomonas sp. P24]